MTAAEMVKSRKRKAAEPPSNRCVASHKIHSTESIIGRIIIDPIHNSFNSSFHFPMESGKCECRFRWCSFFHAKSDAVLPFAAALPRLDLIRLWKEFSGGGLAAESKARGPNFPHTDDYIELRLRHSEMTPTFIWIYQMVMQISQNSF